jgi:hypothetical protein
VNRIQIPIELGGPWTHLLILTYGADIPFFESALSREFGSACRNQVILADGDQFLDACATYAQGGLVRHLNQRYVAEGIFTRQAAHAKVILLANEKEGKLLVGSGNLGHRGYTSGGELFCRYIYGEEERGSLNAFIAVRELLDGLIEREYISDQARRRIKHLFNDALWLLTSRVTEKRPVRHNLEQSFLEQLQEAVGSDPVEELWVLSPFYDPGLKALQQLMAALDPATTTLLLQPGAASVEPEHLALLLADHGDRLQVRACVMPDGTPYLHAKLILIKLETRSICLQGSPNLSQVAMLLAEPQGNIEVANLLEGSRDAFDVLFEPLKIDPPTQDIEALELAYRDPEGETEVTETGCRLRSGEWDGEFVSIHFDGALPALRTLKLDVNGRVFAVHVKEREKGFIKLGLSPEAREALVGVVPVRLVSDQMDFRSNPIFCCNVQTLNAVLEIEDDSGLLGETGGLDLGDEDLERLLAELDASLILNTNDVWQIASRADARDADEGEGQHLKYEDIDYALLKRHPKVQQYLRRHGAGQGRDETRVGVILRSITDHFQDLVNPPTPDQIVRSITALDDDAETEQEAEERQEEAERRRRTQAQRNRRAMKNFVRRYLRGVKDTHFQALSGFEILSTNYAIFSHILWVLLTKDWIETEFILDSLLETWRMFWGGQEHKGYIAGLEAGDRQDALATVREYKADAIMVAGLYAGSAFASEPDQRNLRLALRDYWRSWLLGSPFEVDEELMAQVWRLVDAMDPYKSPSPVEIVAELRDLADFETKNSFLRALENRLGLAPGSCRFEEVPLTSGPTPCLVIMVDNFVMTEKIARSILAYWMRACWLRPESHANYWVCCPSLDSQKYRLLYNVETKEGRYRDPTTDLGGRRIGVVAKAQVEWQPALKALARTAHEVNSNIILRTHELQRADRR